MWLAKVSNTITIYPELTETVALYQKNSALETKIEEIKAEIEQNQQEIIRAFFPYLLSIYDKWRPKLGEEAVFIGFEGNMCFDVTIRTVDGYRVRAQEGEKRVFHNFELNPTLKEYQTANFIIPKQEFEKIKELFNFTYY